jgi:hypothetical protein
MIRLVLLAGDLVFVPIESLVPRHRDSEEPIAPPEVPHRLVAGPDFVSGERPPDAMRVPLVVVRAVLVKTGHCGNGVRRSDLGEPGNPGVRGGYEAERAEKGGYGERHS